MNYDNNFILIVVKKKKEFSFLSKERRVLLHISSLLESAISSQACWHSTWSDVLCTTQLGSSTTQKFKKKKKEKFYSSGFRAIKKVKRVICKTAGLSNTDALS